MSRVVLDVLSLSMPMMVRRQMSSCEMKYMKTIRKKSRRKGIVLAVVLVGMVLLLLMLGGLARRVVLEHRAIDSHFQAMQADWLVWSARNRAQIDLTSGNSTVSDWNMTFTEPELGKMVTARVLDAGEKTGDGPPARQIELTWTTASGITIERSEPLDNLQLSAKGAP
jgi:hypothetical protein